MAFYPCFPLNPSFRDSDKHHMSPLWGFGYLVHAAFYKHAAPLGLSAAHQIQDTASIVGAWFPRPSGLGDPTPTVSTVLGVSVF